jgi:hypothetical protein
MFRTPQSRRSGNAQRRSARKSRTWLTEARDKVGTSAFVPQLVQEESCKFSFVSSTLTEGFDLITQSVEYAPFKRRRVGSNPTEVTNRLVVQWTEQLASNEKALGSNPSKATSPPLAQRTEHDVTNVGCRKFESCMGAQLPLAQLVARVPYKNAVERSSRSRKKYCTVAQLAERPAVNGSVIGSIPICAATTDGMRIGKQLVLKTGARKGCRFESMHRPPVRTKSTMVVQVLDKRLVLGSNPSSCKFLARRLTGRTTDSASVCLGSNPSRPCSRYDTPVPFPEDSMVS